MLVAFRHFHLKAAFPGLANTPTSVVVDIGKLSLLELLTSFSLSFAESSSLQEGVVAAALAAFPMNLAGENVRAAVEVADKGCHSPSSAIRDRCSSFTSMAFSFIHQVFVQNVNCADKERPFLL